MGCRICKLAAENERLKGEARIANAKAAKCWVREFGGEMVITIYGEIGKEHYSRLLSLLCEIEDGQLMHAPH